MGFLERIFGRPEPSKDDGPLMEHPTGQFSTAEKAIEHALVVLGNLDLWDD